MAVPQARGRVRAARGRLQPRTLQTRQWVSTTRHRQECTMGSSRPSGRSDRGREKARALEAARAEFDALYERHSREVWALAYARWMNADTAMDITQETFLRLWK